jgi:hypothetical protein
MSIINYFSIVVPNKCGEGVKVLDGLKTAGVNLVAVWGYPIKGKKSVLDIAPEDAKAFSKAVKKMGLEASAKKTAFLVEGEDQLGAVATVMGKLAAAGVSVHAAQAVTAGGGRYGMLLQVGDDDVKKAKKALK